MERIDVWLEPMRAFLIAVGAFLPRLAVAALVLGLGIAVAHAVRLAVRKALKAINFQVITQRAGMDGFLQGGGTQLDTVGLLASLMYWLVILAALVVAFNGMGLTYATELISRVMVFVPRLIVALLVLALGAYFAQFVASAVTNGCRRAGMRDAQVLGQIARYAVLAFIVTMVLDHLEIGGMIVRDAFLIVLGGLVLALALAFGLGGRAWAAAHLERWWPSASVPTAPPPASSVLPPRTVAPPQRERMEWPP